MAAAAALLLTSLKPGSVLAMDAGCYHGVRALIEMHLEPRGVELRLAPPAELAEAASGADLLWLESPSNPELEVYDLAALTGLGVTTVVDNTTAGALLQQPLDLGANYAMTSATKQMSRPRRPDARLRRRRAIPTAPRRSATGAATRARSPARSRRGSRTVPSPRSRFALERGCDNAIAIAPPARRARRRERRALPGAAERSRATRSRAAR